MIIFLGFFIGFVSSALIYANRNVVFSVMKTKNDTVDYVKSDAKVIFDRSVVPFQQEGNKPKQTKKKDVTNEPYLLLGKFIHRSEVACIYSTPGVGKTFLALHIAKEALPQKTVYFSLDDVGDNQLDRVTSIQSIQCISNKQFGEIKAVMKATAVERCQSRAILDKILVVPARIEERKQKLMRELGVADQRKIDDILAFETIAESELCSNADIIIIDSLNALFLQDWLINREYLERITLPFRERNQTLIILHHTNKKGEISGHSSLIQTMDTVLRLDKIGDNYRRITVEKDRYPQGDHDCIVQMVSEGNQSVRFEVCEESIFDNQDGGSSLKDKVIQALAEREKISFDELFQALNMSNPGSLKNCLKRLEDKGYVAKADGKTWAFIMKGM